MSFGTKFRLALRRAMRGWRVRAVMLGLVAMAIVVVWITNELLTQRLTDDTRNRAEVRLAFYSGNILSELQRASVVPTLLANDPTLIGALNSSDYSQSSQRLISYVDEIGAAGLMLLDRDGRAVAATNREVLGSNHRQEPYMVQALRSGDTVFTEVRGISGAYQFRYSRKIDVAGRPLGVIVVEVDLNQFERSWRGFSDAVIVTNSGGEIILATEGRWRGLAEAEALEVIAPGPAIGKALLSNESWRSLPPDTFLLGDSVMRQQQRMPFHGWRMTSFTTFAGVRERVNGVIALEIMIFAILLAGGFYLVSRRANLRTRFFQRESAELRRLNNALQREIVERERAEKNLQVAEQTVAQTSKLAALGEMSAAVSHELNQPLAAMKTYLAGARLLLQRNRPDEAVASFQRLDDLIERMSAITKQLKSYARKDGRDIERLDLRASVSASLSMMEPQLKRLNIKVQRTLPRGPVYVDGNRVRVEQVIVNLLRNAVDAISDQGDPHIEILIAQGDDAILTVRDNGNGIKDLESLFEPFYTTKSPGDGVGLGLAISSGIVADLGGRLTARNTETGGAIFEMRLPLAGAKRTAAE